MKNGFDNEKYLKIQSEHIKERIAQFGDKLYLEFGGKLFDDYHASRVLPGFHPDSKLRMLMQLSDYAEVIIVISAFDIEKNKVRGDLGITYDEDVLRLRGEFEKAGLYTTYVIITHYNGQKSADAYRARLERMGIKVCYHYTIDGYPNNVELIDSDEGFGRNDFAETSRQLVVVTAPGPGSGKMAVCLSQLYHEQKRGVKAGYAKFETFPIWNIPLKHPVNIAYEAATADLHDVNMIDPWHLEAYGETTVNYNRDIEVFPVVNNILTKITGQPDLYRSPTDMGVNMAGYGICDDEAVRQAAKQEIIRRYYKALCDYRQGRGEKETVEHIETLMNGLSLSLTDRAVVTPALEKSEQSGCPAIAIELPNGEIVTGRKTEIMSAAGAAVLNAVKRMAGIRDEILLMSPLVLEPIMKMKSDVLHRRYSELSLSEVLIALSICAATSPVAQLAMSYLSQLSGCEAHSTNILNAADSATIMQLGRNMTSEDEFPSKDLYY